ncbi:MAG: DNA-3-methyladenine glycosylase, partial [Thaumarchaeota archaeon]|nr:DNA-3-methyladenine glycosylase [Nitrososphaerota archaeon]
MSLLSRSFYRRDTVDVAKDLLGKRLVRKIDGITISGIISETEAYRYKDDPASHSFGGKTERNKAMFGEVGKAYVYFTYGMHYCVNAVAKDESVEAGAVLIRALVPK